MRSRPWILVGVLALVLVTLVGTLLVEGRRQENASRGATTDDKGSGDTTGPSLVLPAPPGSSPEMLAPSDPVPVPAPQPAEVAARGLLDTLLADLQEIEERAPADYDVLAARRLEAFVAQLAAPAGAAPTPVAPADSQLGRDVLDALDGRVLSTRVRGALLALAGGLGMQSEVLERVEARGVAWRSALVGLAWSPSGPPPAALELHVSDWADKALRDELTVLDLPLSRPPDDRLTAILAPVALTTAGELDQLYTRDVALLVLGVGIDLQPATLAMFRGLLLDPAPQSQQVCATLLYVLSHARSQEARELVLEFLNHPEMESESKMLARWWIGDRSVVEDELDELIQPLFDPRSTTVDRMSVTGSMLKRIGVATERELERIVEVLTQRVEQETNPTVRLASISTLAEAHGGRNKFDVLERVLRESASGTERMWAAYGMSRLEPGLRSQAEAVLRATLAVETDERVRSRIVDVLGEASLGDG